MTLSEQVQLSGEDTLYFSYGQVLIYDQSEPEPGSLWTEQHVAQGFVRRERALGIGMLTTQGNAIVRVFRGTPESLQSYDRVQSIPIVLNSGVLCIEGPEEYPIERQVRFPAGFYRITVAQSHISDDELNLDLYVESLSSRGAASQILKADEKLHIYGELTEAGEVAH